VTRIAFYVLDEGAEPLQVACRLVERIYRLRHGVYVRARDEVQARALDEALWSYRAGAFVPHRRVGEDGEAPVWIGPADAAAPPAATDDVLVNLADDPAPELARYARIAELVPPDPAQRERARAHYRHYRAAGCTIEQHRLEG
jgi:DNA polymerase III subunit chi